MWIIFLNLRKNEKNWDSFVIALLVSMVRLLKMTLFVLKALNWETNAGYTFNAIFPDNFQTWSTKVFSNIVQEDLNVYPEYVKLGIDFWKLFRYISLVLRWSVWNLTWQYGGSFCILTSSMILVLYVPLCYVSDLSLLMFALRLQHGQSVLFIKNSGFNRHMLKMRR